MHSQDKSPGGTNDNVRVCVGACANAHEQHVLGVRERGREVRVSAHQTVV